MTVDNTLQCLKDLPRSKKAQELLDEHHHATEGTEGLFDNIN